MVLLDRIELSASPLPRECSTTELQQQPGVGEATRTRLLCHRPNLDARLKTAYQPVRSKHESPLAMSKTEQAAQREQRLAAKLRENLKRRKGQIRARAEAGQQAPDAPPAPGTDTVNKL